MRLLPFIFLIIPFLSISQEAQRFGVQLKPLVPVGYFGAGESTVSNDIVSMEIQSRFGYSFGMVYRHDLTKSLSIESGINLVQRNFRLMSFETESIESDRISFGNLSYEIPLQALVYIKLGRNFYMNTSGGVGINFYTSDIYVPSTTRPGGKIDYFGDIYQWMNGSLLANLGFEYRDDEKGTFYLGASIVNTFKPILRSDIRYYYQGSDYTTLKQDLVGNYLTVDLRYFFPLKEEKKK